MRTWLYLALAAVFAAVLLFAPYAVGLYTFVAVGVVVLVGLASALALVFQASRTSLILTPDGVHWGYWPFRGGVTWDEPVPTRNTAVDPAFLTGAIHAYAEHPEHRAGIGTQAEHDRLVRELGAVAA